MSAIVDMDEVRAADERVVGDMVRTFRTRAKALMKAQGYTYERFAGRVNLSESSISKHMAKHGYKPETATVMRYALALGVTADYLLGLSDDMCGAATVDFKAAVEAMKADAGVSVEGRLHRDGKNVIISVAFPAMYFSDTLVA